MRILADQTGLADTIENRWFLKKPSTMPWSHNQYFELHPEANWQLMQLIEQR